jgi:hypothetical protein
MACNRNDAYVLDWTDQQVSVAKRNQQGSTKYGRKQEVLA